MEEIEPYWNSKIIGVYVIEHSEGVYVGSSGDLYKRRYVNESKLRSNTHHCKPLQEAYNSNPFVRFQFFATDSDKRFIKETELLSWYRSSNFNVFNTGGPDARAPGKGVSPSEMTRKKLSESLRRDPENNERSVSIETRIKMSSSAKERFAEDVALQKVSNIIGKPLTVEHRAKMLAALRAKTKPISIEGVRYNGIQDAAEKLSLSYMRVSNRLRSKASRWKDWNWID